jgi:hypothetical protein
LPRKQRPPLSLEFQLNEGHPHSYVYDWVTDYKGHLLLKQLYFENYFFELKRELSCVEIK